MRILVMGAGVLGSNVAADLFSAGKDVTLLARGQRCETIREHGLKIKNRFSIGTKVYRIPVIDALRADDVYDMIFVSVRFNQVASVLPTLLENHSRTIVFNGNQPDAEKLVRALPGKNVLFSFAGAAGYREADRVVSINMHKITIGEISGAQGNEALIRNAFSGTRVRVTYEENMGDYLLSHAAFIVPICFAAYHANGDLRRIRKDKVYLNRVIDANIECYSAIEKAGHTILPPEDREFRTEKWRGKVLKFYQLMAYTFLGKICISDHAMSAVDEMRALAERLREMMRAAGVSSDAFDELMRDTDRAKLS